MVKQYHGDDADLRMLEGAVESAFEGMGVEAFGSEVLAWLGTAVHPVLRRQYLSCGFVPMVELLRYLEANGFTTYIASGGDRDFMRPFADTTYGIPPERVIGSGALAGSGRQSLTHLVRTGMPAGSFCGLRCLSHQNSNTIGRTRPPRP
jgi:hypothetical protein